MMMIQELVPCLKKTVNLLGARRNQSMNVVHEILHAAPLQTAPLRVLEDAYHLLDWYWKNLCPYEVIWISEGWGKMTEVMVII